MSDNVLFQMWEPFRQSLLKGHLFYLEQARKRLLAQFDDIEAEANKAADEWLEQRSHLFDPDRHDPVDFYERAREESIKFYGLLSNMRDQTRLSVVAGMFHEWDKQLRDWLVSEITHWHTGDNVRSKIWAVDFGNITDLLESFGWTIRGTDYYQNLDACRLVVNVYKHGYGKSLEDLDQKYPEYIDSPLREFGGMFSELNWHDYEHLRVTDNHLQIFSDAIVAFWKQIPKNVFSSQVNKLPDWFEKAFLKDHDNHKRAKTP